MAIASLAYLGIRCNRLNDWSSFACQLLGMQLLDKAGSTRAFRMDDHQQRVIVSDEPGDELAFMGWEVDANADLDHYAARLEAQNVSVAEGSKDLCARRYVQRLIYFDDPEGNRIEFVWQPIQAEDPFESGRAVSGFVTGAYGMGHAVLNVKDATNLLPFYTDTLDFCLSDYGLTPYPMYFFHVNGRHHSFALIGSGGTGFHHFMVEYHNLDDVGQGYDIALQETDRIAYTLGRHTNDYMTSFYAKSPTGFFVESGWGGRIINPNTWQSHETFNGPSFWGHDRPFMSDEHRQRLNQMKLDAAAKGLQAPALIDCPWLYRARH
ncbi:MAG: VOC family protein [Gammaproteobacteria bacterium]|nr:VOC family protein [Gammaproteobacteria bacterium]